jgi:hypothetical protein
VQIVSWFRWNKIHSDRDIATFFRRCRLAVKKTITRAMEWPHSTKAPIGDLFYVLYNKKETSFTGEPYTVAWFETAYKTWRAMTITTLFNLPWQWCLCVVRSSSFLLSSMPLWNFVVSRAIKSIWVSKSKLLATYRGKLRYHMYSN